MDQQLVIRRILANEWPTYKTLRLNALRLAPDAFCTKLTDVIQLPDEEWRQRVQRFAADPRVINFLAFLNQQAVGMVSCYAEKQAEMVQMWVEPCARGLGVGRELVQALKLWVTTNTDQKILLADVVKSNAQALSLYQRLGFEVVRESGQPVELHLRCEL